MRHRWWLVGFCAAASACSSAVDQEAANGSLPPVTSEVIDMTAEERIADSEGSAGTTSSSSMSTLATISLPTVATGAHEESTTTLPQAEIRLYEKRTECLPEGSWRNTSDTQIWFDRGEGASYDPRAEAVPIPQDSTFSIRPSDLPPSGDVDGDGVIDTLQFVDVGSPEGSLVAEGIRVCGTSRPLNPYFVSPSNGNFGAIVVPFENGPAGILNRPPSGPVQPSDVWLFDESGNLLPPYARDGVDRTSQYADYGEGFAALKVFVEAQEWQDLGGEPGFNDSDSFVIANVDGTEITISTGWRQPMPLGSAEDLGPHPDVWGRQVTYPSHVSGTWFECKGLSILALGESPFVELFVQQTWKELAC